MAVFAHHYIFRNGDFHFSDSLRKNMSRTISNIRPRILLTINRKSTGSIDELRIICQGFIHALMLSRVTLAIAGLSCWFWHIINYIKQLNKCMLTLVRQMALLWLVLSLHYSSFVIINYYNFIVNCKQKFVWFGLVLVFRSIYQHLYFFGNGYLFYRDAHGYQDIRINPDNKLSV